MDDHCHGHLKICSMVCHYISVMNVDIFVGSAMYCSSSHGFVDKYQIPTF